MKSDVLIILALLSHWDPSFIYFMSSLSSFLHFLYMHVEEQRSWTLNQFLIFLIMSFSHIPNKFMKFVFIFMKDDQIKVNSIFHLLNNHQFFSLSILHNSLLAILKYRVNFKVCIFGMVDILCQIHIIWIAQKYLDI